MNTLNKKIKSFKGFTLVELIVVISILAILGTIAFLSFNNYSSSARDSQRISDTTNLKKGLDIYQANSGFYPMPEGSISTGVILGTEVTYMGIIQDQVSGIAKISKTPKDPSTNNPYIYGITYDKKQYQIALALESSNTVYNNQQNLITQTTYAASEQARVIGNYLGSLKFKSGATNTYIANVPSLIYNFSGSVSDLITNQSQVYFVINKNTNLPYKVKADSIINNKSANQLIQELTNSGASTLTGVNITSILSLTDSTAQKTAINNLFTGSTLVSFNLNGLDSTNPTNITTIQSQIQSQVLGTVASVSTPTPTPTYTCSGALVVANATITNNTNLTANTNYQTTNSANNCYYTCKVGYSGTNCEITPPICPVGFIYIPTSTGKSVAGYTSTKGWCVAKYEMTPYDISSGWTQDTTYFGWKCTTLTDSATNPCGGALTKKITSKAQYNPITYVSRNEAEAACTGQLVDSSNNPISNGHLLNVELWSLIARDIEQDPINWSGNTPGSGNMSRGLASGTPNSTSITKADNTDSTTTIGNPTASNYYDKRVWRLKTTGEIIHDFAGNVWEWYYDMHASSCSAWAELTTNTFSYNGISLEPSVNTYNSTHGIGQICSVNATIPTTPTYASIFGGSWNYTTGAGVFASNWDTYSPSTSRGLYIGFRCIAPAN